VIFQIARTVAVVALLGVAAAIATPKDRLPLALRGLARILRRDAALPQSANAPVGRVSPARRLLAFAIVIIAILLAVW
jgi:hypothetical protein